ncbi:hypothetical protein ACWDZ4_04090 [Streptomyces sp. NPDC003016]
MNRTRPATAAWAPALLYVGLVTAAGLAHGIAGAPRDHLAGLYFATFPGSVLVTVFALLPLGALFGAGDPAAGGAANPFGPMVYLTGGALVNVLLVRAVVTVVRKAASVCRAG